MAYLTKINHLIKVFAYIARFLGYCLSLDEVQLDLDYPNPHYPNPRLSERYFEF